MKVVLSTPPGKTTELWPPLGLLYIASSTKAKRGDSIHVIDAFCENLSGDQLVSRVVSEKPDVFGINCSTHTFLSAMDSLEKMRKELPETKLVLGGFHATFAAERILKEYPFVDYLLKGEAEHSFPKLLQAIEEGKKPNDVEGISYRDGQTVIGNPMDLIEDLDALPFPDRALAKNVEYGYFHGNVRLTFGKFTTISSSRGCPFKCAYCSCAAFSLRKWRPRSPENVIAELEQLYGEGYESCVFVDDNLTHGRRRIEKICDLIRERRIKMQFYCEGRVDNAPPELMRKMKSVGFNVMYFGVESPHEHVLDYYRKTTRAEQAVKAIDAAKSAGMIVTTSYIMGAPVESKEDRDKAIEFIRKTRPHALQVNILDCLIGTEIWERFEKEGTVKPEDWKRNHRIYEYNTAGPTKEELEEDINRSFSAYLESWKSKSGVIELLGTLVNNRTARTVVVKNLLNSDARRMISSGRKLREK